MCRGPRDRNGVVTFYLVKEDIYPRDNLLVSNRFDGPSSKQLHTTIAVGDDVVTRGGCQIQVLALLLDPVEGVVYGIEFPGIARGSPGTTSQLGPERDADTGPHIARVSAPTGKVMWTPQPADPVGRAEPSVNRNAEGLSSKGSLGPVDLEMYSSAFFRVEKRLTSERMPMVWGLASRQEEYMPGTCPRRIA